MARRFVLLSVATAWLAAAPLSAQVTVQEEFDTVLWKIAHHVYNYYYEAIPPDSLVQAGARGIFLALDPASEYTLDASGLTLGQSFWNLKKLTQIVSDSALYAVSPDTLIRFGIAGMMEILDPYTVFMERRNLDNFNIQTRGHYGGLGFRIQVVYPDSAIAVWSLLHEDTPAARAGIRSGDLILAINDSTTRHMTTGDAADSMRGPPGTPVRLTLSRAGVPAPFDLTIVRQEVQMRSVPYYTLFPDSTGYIKLDRFQSKSSQEVRDAINDLLRQGMKRAIFDLRGNGGGYLQEAVEVADLFLPLDRLVVFTAGRAFPDTNRFVTRQPALLPEQQRLMVLVDRTSASASEIVAGAIQDWDRGLVLGSPTVGKGSVQQTLEINDRAELKLTMAAWHTPSGRSIDRRMRKDSTRVDGAEKYFTTRHLNRRVRGGGGITPDIAAHGRRATPLYNQLYGVRTLNSQFFSFARQYHLNHAPVTTGFRAEARTVGEFREFATGRGFEYVSDTQAPLLPLAEQVEKEQRLERLQKHVRRLIAEIDKLEEEDWDANAELLQWKLTHDILEKNLGVAAAMAYDVSVDPQVTMARRIIADPLEYEGWFRRPEIGVEEETVAQHLNVEDLE